MSDMKCKNKILFKLNPTELTQYKSVLIFKRIPVTGLDNVISWNKNMS
jgi:hypothetical protein